MCFGSVRLVKWEVCNGGNALICSVLLSIQNTLHIWYGIESFDFGLNLVRQAHIVTNVQLLYFGKYDDIVG